MISQGEIVEVNFPLPNGFKPHPVLVISQNEVNEIEGAFIGMMLSTKNLNPELTFEITDEMTSKAAFKKRYAICHLVAIISEEEILGRYGFLKKKHLLQLLEKFKNEII